MTFGAGEVNTETLQANAAQLQQPAREVTGTVWPADAEYEPAASQQNGQLGGRLSGRR